MALGDPYASLAELKSYVGIGDDVEDAKLMDALSSASVGIEQYCGRQFNDAGTATARVYRPRDYCVVEVDDFSTTTGLIVATDDGDTGTYSTTWSTSDYQVEPLNGVWNGTPGWPYWRIRSVLGRLMPAWARHASVQVTARWGWTNVPAPVKQACLIVAAETYKLKDAPFGVAGYGEFGVMRVRDNPMARARLDPYRRTAVLIA